MNIKKLWKKLRQPEESLRAFAHRMAKDPKHSGLATAWFKGKKDAHKTAVRKPRITRASKGLISTGKKKGKKE